MGAGHFRKGRSSLPMGGGGGGKQPTPPQKGGGGRASVNEEINTFAQVGQPPVELSSHQEGKNHLSSRGKEKVDFQKN